MTRRTVGIDLAVRGDQVARIFDDGLPVGKPIRFRLDPASLDRFVAKTVRGLPAGATAQALMEPIRAFRDHDGDRRACDVACPCGERGPPPD